MKILIIGAGAGGLVTGYHFALSDAEVTFFVRPSRMEEMADKPKQLYCYEDNKVRTFSAYETICDMDAVAAGQFDYVISTLDGSSMQSDEGKALLRHSGEAIASSQTVFVCLGAARDVEALILKQTGLPMERCLFGSFSFLSHNVPLPTQRFDTSIDKASLSECDYAYTHLGKNKAGLVLFRKNQKLAKQFAEIYGRSGVSTCSVMPNFKIVDCLSYFLAPSFVAFEIEAWPEPKDIYKSETWGLAEKATLEIFALPQHGFLGKIVAVLSRPFSILTKMYKNMDADAAPLDFHAFNKFHHGGKVLEQDLEMARHTLEAEEQRGRKMPNLRALLARLDS